MLQLCKRKKARFIYKDVLWLTYIWQNKTRSTSNAVKGHVLITEPRQLERLCENDVLKVRRNDSSAGKWHDSRLMKWILIFYSVLMRNTKHEHLEKYQQTVPVSETHLSQCTQTHICITSSTSNTTWTSLNMNLFLFRLLYSLSLSLEIRVL